MRIGLIRHFPVDLKPPSGWVTAADLQTWVRDYDQATTVGTKSDLGGVAWRTCICSDLPRASVTAGVVYSGAIEHTALLREFQFATFQTGELRLPLWAWHCVLRLAWLTGHSSQRACRDGFHQRVLAAADRLCAVESDTLVVSHGGMMIYLSAELRRRGFAGPRLRIPKHGQAYIYEKRSL